MEQYEVIRIAHRVYGKRIREIARELGHHRRTVRKALRGEEPRYRRKEALKNEAMNAWEGIIDSWSREDRQHPRKQRHTARRVYQRLKTEYGFAGAESTVRRWVRQRKRHLGLEYREAMVPLCPEIGQEAEVDWGEAEVWLQGKSAMIKYFCMRSRYSGKLFVGAYPGERQEMLFDAHLRAFAFFGGIYPVLVYDNMTTAVLKVFKGRRRIEQEQFRSFRGYYTFEARF